MPLSCTWMSGIATCSVCQHFRNLFTVERATTHAWNGFVFPALTDEDAFLLQVVHACQHLFALWIRMSCFLEIGYFLKRRVYDTALWNQIEQRVGDNLMWESSWSWCANWRLSYLHPPSLRWFAPGAGRFAPDRGCGLRNMRVLSPFASSQPTSSNVSQGRNLFYSSKTNMQPIQGQRRRST